MSNFLNDIDLAWLKANSTDERGILQPLLEEVLVHRATMKRLEQWAVELEASLARGVEGGVHGGVGHFIAAELRNRIKGS